MKTLSKGEWLTLGIGGVVIIIVAYLLIQTPSSQPAQTQAGSAVGSLNPITNTTNTTQVNKTTASVGDTVTVNYTGKLKDGTKFDSSYDRGQPFSFTLGAGQVIKGWDEGLVGMKVGEKKTLTITADKGYGATGVKDPQTGKYVIPPNATLVFDVELVSVK